MRGNLKTERAIYNFLKSKLISLYNYMELNMTMDNASKVSGIIVNLTFGIIRSMFIIITLFTGLGLVGSLKIFGAIGSKLFDTWSKFMDDVGRKRVIMDRSGDQPYLERYYLLFMDRGNNIPFNVFLHKFIKSDEDVLHDHPWSYFTFILSGGYWEYKFKDRENSVETVKEWRPPGFFQFMPCSHAHRVELDPSKPYCWTLFIPFQHKREWGFWKVNTFSENIDDKINKQANNANKELLESGDEKVTFTKKDVVDSNVDIYVDSIGTRVVKRKAAGKAVGKQGKKLNKRETTAVEQLIRLAEHFDKPKIIKSNVEWVNNKDYKND